MASTGPLVLSELVKEPFGPFKDSDILNHTCKSIRTKPLTLSNVILRADGRIVGYVSCLHVIFNRHQFTRPDSIRLSRISKSIEAIRPSKSLVY